MAFLSEMLSKLDNQNFVKHQTPRNHVYLKAETVDHYTSVRLLIIVFDDFNQPV